LEDTILNPKASVPAGPKYLEVPNKEGVAVQDFQTSLENPLFKMEEVHSNPITEKVKEKR